MIQEPMLGRTKFSLPVCTLRSAAPCAGLEPCMLFTKQSSSTTCATFGKRSLTQAPLCPYWRNFHGLPSRFPVSANWTRGLAPGKGLPWSAWSFGL